MSRPIFILGCGAAVAAGLSVNAESGHGRDGWWSLRPLVRRAAPEARESGPNPIDAFIRAKLAETGGAPAAEADRRTLARRLWFGLTGLSPTPEEVDAFAADPDPRAYERIVDRLLASPRYGEQWARHWLDVAGYAETHGNDHDFARPNAWPFRDYVIRALNEDKPYGRFVAEQVAGDALFPDDPQATVALGFLAAGPWDHTLMVTVREDTVDHRMAQHLDRDAMVTTVMGTFQSLTVHCARCHDHKFDPITQSEYYSLQAVFAGVDRVDRPFDSDARVHVERRRIEDRRRGLRLRDPRVLASLETPDVQAAVEMLEKASRRREEAWTPFEVLSVVSTGGATVARESDGSWCVTGTRPDRDTYIVTARRPAGRFGAVRLEVLPDDRHPQRGPGRWDNGNLHLTEFRVFAARESGAVPLTFTRAVADFDEASGVSASQAIDGKNETHWGVHPRVGERHQAVFDLKEPVAFPDGTVFTLLLEHQGAAPGHGIGRFRLSAAADALGDATYPLPAAIEAVLHIPPIERTGAQRRELALALLTADNERALAALPRPQTVYAVAKDFPPDGPNFKPSPQPRPIHVLTRGELDRPGAAAVPGTLGCVHGLPPDLDVPDPGDEASRRAALARWLSAPANALTWRSIVNRVWHYHFNRGLCESPNDFGRMGAEPSHPELLDWLAVWFRDDAGASLKALHRLIVTSATFRQASHRGLGDPDNRLLARGPSRRLSAEEVRDSVLQFSGRLDLTMAGPAAVQFVAKGAATFLPADGSPPFVDYESFDPDAPENRRRAVYRFRFRTVPDPLMDALDCPDGGAAAPVRLGSTTAQQALALMHDPFLIRQCEHLAERATHEAGKPDPRDGGADELQSAVARVFRLVLLRDPTGAEAVRVGAYARRHGLANAAHILLNSNEYIHID